ncbi:MAG: glucose-1-phosphate thymidylyltransferase [Firmicutes bacterium]|nr:glucose-1-phosphate thymidylyltransferase [Bacillota bacterium]
MHPNDFFDLAGFAHTGIFAGVQYVWEAMNRLDKYVCNVVHTSINGKLMPGAIVSGEVMIGDGTIVEPGAVIIGPTLIGRNCIVRQGAYLRGNIIVGNNCIIGHASEVKSSILFDEVEIPHFAYVGNSLLGKGVLLGAGVRCSNRTLLGGTIKIKVGKSLYDTGLTRFGAVVGDHVAIGSNCVLNPGTLIGKGTLVYPNASLRGYYPENHIVKIIQTQEVCRRV